MSSLCCFCVKAACEFARIYPEHFWKVLVSAQGHSVPGSKTFFILLYPVPWVCIYKLVLKIVKTFKGKEGFICWGVLLGWAMDKAVGLLHFRRVSSPFQTINQRHSPLSWWNSHETFAISSLWQFPCGHFGGAWDKTDMAVCGLSLWCGLARDRCGKEGDWLQVSVIRLPVALTHTSAELQPLTGVSQRRICVFNYGQKVFWPLLCTRNYSRLC